MYQNKKIRCGKENCTQCPHDGFIYVTFKISNKTRTFYLGKLDKITIDKIKEISNRVKLESNDNNFWAGLNIDAYGKNRYCYLEDVMLREFIKELGVWPIMANS